MRRMGERKLNIDKEMRKRTRLSLPHEFLIPVCIIVSVLLFLSGLFISSAAWFKTYLLAACVILAGYDMLFDALIKIIKRRSFDRNLLVFIASIGAFIIGRAPEGAAVVLFYRIGAYLQDQAIERSRSAIADRLDLRPDIVNAIVNGAAVRLSVGKIKTGDIISVAPGERIALDGIVIGGESALDLSGITGEYEPVNVTDGSKVISGSINITGTLSVRVTMGYDNSTISRVLKLVEEAENKKSKKEKSITRLARNFTPGVVAAALILGVFVPLIGGLEFHSWMYRAFGFLSVSGTGAFVVSVSLTYFAGIARASKKGILFKGADIVDKAAHTTSVIFSKTGTLTQGCYKVSEINAYEISEERLLMLASYAELRSNHPIARAIIAAAKFELDESKITDFREIQGKGTEVDIGGITVSAGNALHMEELGLTPDISQAEASLVYIAVNGKYAGRIVLSDTVMPDAKKAVKELNAIGIDRIAIFTGDRKEAAVDVASQLGIREFYAECLPEEKVTRLKGLTDMQLSGDKLIFVGDGISDAPVLRIADVGVAMGGLGSDDVIEAADMVIIPNMPSRIVSAIEMARDTNKIVRQNILLSVGIKGILLLVLLLGVTPMWLAVSADAIVSIAAAINAVRAFGFSGQELTKALLKREQKIEECFNTETE